MQRISSQCSSPLFHAVYPYRGYFLILLCPVSIRTHTSFRAICVPVGHFDDAFVAIFLEARLVVFLPCICLFHHAMICLLCHAHSQSQSIEADDVRLELE